MRTYRERVGVNEAGASLNDPKDVSTFSHMFGCWETLYVIKQAVEKSGYKKPGPADYKALIEALGRHPVVPEGLEHPQGRRSSWGASTRSSVSR